MNIQEHINNMTRIQKNLLSFLDCNTNIEENFSNLINLFNDANIQENKPMLTLFLHLLSSVSQYHYRTPGFQGKIERILNFFKQEIKKNYDNKEIFKIFKKSKRILLFLLEEKMIVFDKYIVQTITNRKYVNYIEYFYPEIQPFMNEEWFQERMRSRTFQTEIPENFYENRKEGENESYICKLIRKDSIDDFITYVKKNNYPLNSIIDSSIYETNDYILKKSQFYNRMTLIEYAVFYGSTQIFNYLRLNGVNLQKQLWFCAVHGNDEEIIHTLEENNITLDDASAIHRYFNNSNTYKDLFFEAIKCHHNDVANYIINNYLANSEEKSEEAFINYIKYYNFSSLEVEFIKKSSLFDFIKYDYYSFIYYLIQNKDIDFQATKIQKNNDLIIIQ